MTAHISDYVDRITGCHMDREVLPATELKTHQDLGHASCPHSVHWSGQRAMLVIFAPLVLLSAE